MADTTITATRNGAPRKPITANTPYTIQIDPLLTTQNTNDRPVKLFLHTGTLLFARPGTTCIIDDPMADIVGTGQYINITPSNTTHTITVIADTDSLISVIRRP